MANQRQRRILIYKRTHESDSGGDPNEYGVFGIDKCMKRVRSWEYTGVIGVGGIGSEARSWGIDRKINWIGIGPHKDKQGEDGHPLVTFEHYWKDSRNGPLLEELAPKLARRMYGSNVRVLMVKLSDPEWPEVETILDRAKNAPRSRGLQRGQQQEVKRTSSKCRSSSCRAASAVRKIEQENPPTPNNSAADSWR